MGWSGGSELMSEVISAVQALQGVDDKQIELMYRKLIVAFEDQGCDVLEECVGEDSRFDNAIAYQCGFDAGSVGASLDENPFNCREFPGFYDLWNEGRHAGKDANIPSVGKWDEEWEESEGEDSDE